VSEKKKILILGAGRQQVPLITAAIGMQLEVHVCSIQGNYPGIEIAPNFYEVDISDSIAVFELAKEIGIHGIITTGTDVCLESIGVVVDGLNLPGTCLESSKSCLNKTLMKERFSRFNVPTASYALIESVESGTEFFNSHSSACVIKPADSSGSRGVNRIERASEILAALVEAQKHSASGEIIIEEWLEGEEFGAQAIIIDGKLKKLMLHSDITTPPPRRIPIGHGCPHPAESDLMPMVWSVVEHAVSALGINNTISNIDFILAKDGPKIIEMTSRMGGTHLPEVCGTFWGIDMYDTALQIALGIDPVLPPSPLGVPNAIQNLIFDQSGKVVRLGTMNEEFVWNLYFGDGDDVTLNAAKQAELGYVQDITSDVESLLESVTKAAEAFCNTTEYEVN
tara:strand:- start:47 stop:1234 length:1188 start_codon:yes stop_codon:yes gene_type:complete